MAPERHEKGLKKLFFSGFGSLEGLSMLCNVYYYIYNILIISFI